MATLLKDETVCSAEYNEVEREVNKVEQSRTKSNVRLTLGKPVKTQHQS